MGLNRKAASGEIKSAWTQGSATLCVWKHKGQMGQTSPDLLADYKGSSVNQYYLFPLTSWMFGLPSLSAHYKLLACQGGIGSSFWPFEVVCSCKGRMASACVCQLKQFSKYKTSCSLISLFDWCSLSPVKGLLYIFKTLFVLPKSD